METLEKGPGIEKIETSIEGFDLISERGLPKGRTTLITGTSVSAKTVFAVQFLSEGIIKKDEPGVFVTFEEPPEDIRKNVIFLGWDVAKWEQEGKWAFVDASPIAGEDHVIAGEYDLGALPARIEHAVHKIGAKRVSMDSLGAIFGRFSDSGLVRAELFKIAAAVKQMGVTASITAERTQEVAGLFTSTTGELMGGTSVTEAHISTLTDTIILLRYVEMFGEMRRGITALKMRGSMHDKEIREFNIDGQGMHIGKAFSNVTGIISGHPVFTSPAEVDRVKDLFK